MRLKDHNLSTGGDDVLNQQIDLVRIAEKEYDLGPAQCQDASSSAQLPALLVTMAPTSQPWAIINSRMLSRCSAMARPSCRLPQVNVPNVTQRLANDRMTPRMCVFAIFSQASDRKLTRFPEPSGAVAFNTA